ncbi:DNA-binding response regulator [Duganella sp. BJB488]|uniref:response regulator transcription factor n=1 Tax=unclassified Duganella TaxID=2636909 RepID=UPI000E349F89|nr:MULTISPECIES: response regulator [unclassified Duganella]RFP09144.1 DNA-binding response regulator [Duganella sp. BJB489]RFP12575.1 DNA-binding response regulator [Duganella sp. BJB488]RFP29141.1 DNA-binding response regulator [Duganella sp. BJB480]
MSGLVHLVDDQPAVLKALARLLGAAGYTVRAYAGAQDFLDALAGDADGCLVLDLSMPGMDGLALQQALAARAPQLPIIFLTGHGDIDSGVRAMKLGAADFLTKPVDDARLIAAIEAALAQQRRQRGDDAELAAIRQRLATLTPRETEVLELLVEGLLNKQVAAALGTVEKTVKVHRARVMAKMQVRSPTALVRLVDRARRG